MGATARALRLGRAAAETPEAVVVGIAREILDLGLVLDGPVDQPHAVEDRDLQDHGQEDDRYHLSHPAEVYLGSAGSLTRLGGALGPGLERLDVPLDQADIRFGGDQQSGSLPLLGPLVTALVEAVVDPGERAGSRVLLEGVELPMCRPEPGAPVEGQIG